MELLAIVDWASATVGFVFGLLLLAVGKAIDYKRGELQRDLAQATILGELRAGFAGMSRRVSALESKIESLHNELDGHCIRMHRLYTGEQQ